MCRQIPDARTASTLPVSSPSTWLWPSSHQSTDTMVPQVSNCLWLLKLIGVYTTPYPTGLSNVIWHHWPFFPSKRHLFLVFSDPVFSCFLHTSQAAASLIFPTVPPLPPLVGFPQGSISSFLFSHCTLLLSSLLHHPGVNNHLKWITLRFFF